MVTDRLNEAHQELQSKPCTCGYCKEGMSKTASECVDRMVEAHRVVREGMKVIQKGGKHGNH